jgi:ligand-binding sensor domain-containing protein
MLYDPARRPDSAHLRAGGKIFTCFTLKDGLLNNDVWSILEDKTGNLWVGTRKTILHRFDGKRFTSYTE